MHLKNHIPNNPTNETWGRLLGKTFKNYKGKGNLQRLPCGRQPPPQKQKNEIKMKTSWNF
jgi:hypothetical protein